MTFRDVDYARRVLPVPVWNTFGPLLNQLLETSDRWSIAGSVRRLVQDPKDLDLVVEHRTEAARTVLAFAQGFPPEDIQRVYPEGETIDPLTIKTGGLRLLGPGAKADIRLCQPEQFGACLLWLTGPREFNKKLEKAAKGRMLEFGSDGLSGLLGRQVDCRDESDLYRCIAAGTDLPRELPLPQYR